MMDLKGIEQVRENNPVVVNYANFVTPFLVANGLNAVGASPIMSDEVSEAEELVQLASAVVINAGAAQRSGWQVIEKLCASANQYHKPLVLDPVAVGATKYRQELNLMLLEKYHFDVIRGNVGEIAVLAGVEWQTHGIDAGDGDGNLAEVVKTCAQKFNNVVIASGEVDYISDGTHVAKIYNNTKLLPAIVGSGDLLSSIAAAFCAVVDNPYQAAIDASLELSCAGERMAETLQHRNLPGSFLNGLMDELANITSDQINAMMKVEEV
jgi:hydroxyethylthiazole kinase